MGAKEMLTPRVLFLRTANSAFWKARDQIESKILRWIGSFGLTRSESKTHVN
jgi:hypothetical protein